MRTETLENLALADQEEKALVQIPLRPSPPKPDPRFPLLSVLFLLITLALFFAACGCAVWVGFDFGTGKWHSTVTDTGDAANSTKLPIL
jgi:hypothetical protein